jgi:hypothetical protein
MDIRKMWDYQLNAPVVAQPAVVAVDGEPLVILAASNGRVMAVDGHGRERWRSEVCGIPGTMSVVALDGGPNVIIGDDRGRLNALRMDGSRLWSVDVCDFHRPESWNRGMTPSTGIAELRGNDSVALAVTDRSGTLTTLDAEGRLVWQAHLTSESHFQCLGRPAVADLDGDGVDEIVVSGFDGRAHCLSATGEWRWSTEVMPAEGGYHSPLIVDWGDGPRVLLLGMRDAVLRCLDGNGDDIWEYQGAGAVGIHAGLSPVVIGGESHILIAYNKSGLELITATGRRVWYREFHGGNQPFGPSVADIDGDGNPEILLARTNNRMLWILDTDGVVREEIEQEGPSNGSPLVWDLDGDGIPEFVNVNAETGRVTAYKSVDAQPGGTVQWPASRGTFHGRGSTTLGLEPGCRETSPRHQPGHLVEALGRETPGTFVTGRQPIRYAIDDNGADARILHVSVVGPDGIPHIYLRYPDDAVHGWVEPYRDGVYQLHAMLYTETGTVSRTSETFEFTAFAAERNRGAELLSVINALFQDDEATLHDGMRHSVRKAEDQWCGLLARMDRAEENRERLAGEVHDHLSRLERLLRCGERVVELGQRKGAPADMLVWQPEHPWVPFFPAYTVAPEHLLGEMKVVTEQRSHEATVVAIANVTGDPLDVRVWLDDWDEGEGPRREAVTLRRLVHVPTARERMSPDALPGLDEAGILSIPAGESAMLWLDWAADESAAGTYTSELHIRALTVAGQVWSIPLEWEILPFALPRRMPLWFHVWAYNNSLPGDADAVWQDLLDHHMNVFDLPLPAVSFDSHGEIGSVDWSATGRVLDRAPKGSFFVWHGGEGIITAADDAPGVGSEPWRKAYEQFARLWIAHLTGQGIEYDRHANYIIDEPGIDGGVKVDYFERIARIWKSIDPSVRIYCNPGGGATHEHVERIVEYADVLGPNWGEYRGVPDVYHPGDETVPTTTEPNEFMRTIRDSAWMMWTYRCDGGVKDFQHMRYYWEPIWQGPRANLTGLGFWSYAGRQVDFWQGPNPNDTDYELVYTGASGPVPSRRWQGLRMGIEDDARLRMVLQIADQARDRGDEELSDRLKQLRERLIDRVLESGIDEGVVAEVRAEFRTLLVEHASEGSA